MRDDRAAARPLTIARPVCVPLPVVLLAVIAMFVSAMPAAARSSAPTLAATGTAAATTSRLAGADRYATAAAISASTFAPGVPVVFVATGAGFPDALSAGPAAAASGGPILLVKGAEVPEATAAELLRLRPGRIVVVGGPGVIPDSTLSALGSYAAEVTRLAGEDRYATSAAISAAAFPVGVATAYVATGANFPDALAAAAVAARDSHPILLVKGSAIPGVVASELARLQPGRIVVVGGPGVIPDPTLWALRDFSGTVVRVAGETRTSTAVAISQASHGSGVPVVYLATGWNFPDALATAPIARPQPGPVLLVRSTILPAEVAAELGRLRPARIVAVGGPSAVSDGVLAAAGLAADRPGPPACTYADVLTARHAYGDWATTLLDTIHMLPASYAPGDLVDTSAAGMNGGHAVRRHVIGDLAVMARDASAAGAPVAVQSAYRSYATQQATFDYWVSVGGWDYALRTSARAGHSEHQLGTTLDFRSANGGAPWDVADWATTPAGAWMRDNAWRYGFVMSYPAGSEAQTCYAYEPWHYRYVGRDIARLIHDSGMTPRAWIWAAFGS